MIGGVGATDRHPALRGGIQRLHGTSQGVDPVVECSIGDRLTTALQCHVVGKARRRTVEKIDGIHLMFLLMLSGLELIDFQAGFGDHLVPAIDL